MSEENESSNMERLKALRGGNRSAVTKVEKEALTIICEGLDKDTGEIVDLNIHLNSLKITLRDKLLHLKELDSKLLENFSNSDIAREIEEKTSWETRIHEVLSRIEEFTKGRYHAQRYQQSQVQNNVSGTDDIGVSSRTRVGTRDQVFQSPDFKMEFLRRLIVLVHLW